MIQRFIPNKLLLPLGILLIVAPNIVERYIAVPDFMYGLSIGCGIGLMIHFISSNKWKKTSNAENNES